MVKSKDFSRPLSVYQFLFKANYIFRDFSRQSSILCTFQAFANPGLQQLTVVPSTGNFLFQVYYEKKMFSFCALDFKAVNIYRKNKLYDCVSSPISHISHAPWLVESRLMIVYAKWSSILTYGFRTIEKFEFSLMGTYGKLATFPSGHVFQHIKFAIAIFVESYLVTISVK